MHVDLAEESSLLQVTVGDVTLGVVDAHQGILNVLRKRVTPVVAVAVCVKEDYSPMPALASVSASPSNDGCWGTNSAK